MKLGEVFEQLAIFECRIPPQLMLPHLSFVCLNITKNLRPDLIDQVFLPTDLYGAVYKRKQEFLAGRYCASKALSRLGVSVGLISRNEDRTPHWPMKYTGSISHTDTQAIACVAEIKKYSAVGIDIEKIITEDFYPALKNYVITHSEFQLINHHQGYDLLTVSTLIFSAKESLYKLLYKQTDILLDFLSACLVDLCCGELTLQLNCDVNEKYKKGSIIKGRYVIESNIVITLLVEENKIQSL